MDGTPNFSILRCLACDYDLTGIAAGACPECGITSSQCGEWAEMRKTLESSSADLASRQVLTILLVPVAYGATAGIFFGSLASIFGTTIGVWLVVVLSSVAVMAFEAVSRLAYEPRHRALIGLTWDRQFLFVHSPWLLSPVFGGILLAFVSFSQDDALLVYLGVFVCLAIVLVIWYAATERIDRDLKAMGIRVSGMRRLGASLALLGGMAVACIPGFVLSMIFALAFHEVL